MCEQLENKSWQEVKKRFDRVRKSIVREDNDQKGYKEDEEEYGESKCQFAPTRPSSMSNIRNYSTDRLSESPTVSNYELTITLLKQQIINLQSQLSYQSNFIESLKKENFYLKSQLELHIIEDKNITKSRPQSCMKNTYSSPKNSHVVFAEDLTKIKYIPSNSRKNLLEHTSENLYGPPSDCISHHSRANTFETSSSTLPNDRSLKTFTEEKKAQRAKHASNQSELNFGGYFRERYLKIWKPS